MQRRDFLHSAGAALAASALLGPSRVWAAAHAADVPETLGIQLYSLRDIAPGDLVGTLEMLTRFGYGEVETAGYYDRAPAVVRDLLDALGLRSPAAHSMVAEVIPPTTSMADAFPPFDEALAAAAAVGHDYLVVPWLPEDARPDRDGYLRLADTLNGLGERAQAAGIQLGYHNHDFEFETFGTDRPAYFDFVERLDPDLVVLELDLYWSTKAGYDGVEIFQRYPGRFPLWHVKDGAGPDMAQTDVGAGAIDFERLFAASETAGLRHAFIEHDNPADPLAFARASIEYVESLRDE